MLQLLDSLGDFLDTIVDRRHPSRNQIQEVQRFIPIVDGVVVEPFDRSADELLEFLMFRIVQTIDLIGHVGDDAPPNHTLIAIGLCLCSVLNRLDDQIIQGSILHVLLRETLLDPGDEQSTRSGQNGFHVCIVDGLIRSRIVVDPCQDPKVFHDLFIDGFQATGRRVVGHLFIVIHHVHGVLTDGIGEELLGKLQGIPLFHDGGGHLRHHDNQNEVGIGEALLQNGHQHRAGTGSSTAGSGTDDIAVLLVQNHIGEGLIAQEIADVLFQVILHLGPVLAGSLGHVLGTDLDLDAVLGTHHAQVGTTGVDVDTVEELRIPLFGQPCNLGTAIPNADDHRILFDVFHTKIPPLEIRMDLECEFDRVSNLILY